ncbi:MAG: hypothetical protein HeimC3_17520 [Candidatus Heimdallarchaeota archaeon LC_3]|nr:MAG: hypothetical protein HeimC3_17520 [Candidatus Heimdallarchaeota archaeon LC_3]
MEQQNPSSNPPETDKKENSKNLNKQREGNSAPENSALNGSISVLENSSEESSDELPANIQEQETSDSETTEEPIKLNIGDLRYKIDEMESEVRSWRSKREELNNQVIEKAKSRNDLNTKVKELITTANEAKVERDKANAEINKLKEEKNEFHKEIERLVAIVEKTEREQNKPQKNIPLNVANKKIKKLQQDMQTLEWKLQTTGNITIQEERDVVERIGAFEQELEDLLKYQESSKERQEAGYKLRVNRQKLRKTIQSMNKLARDSRAFHTTMIQGYHEANKIRKEADAIHADIQKIKERADAIHAEYVNKIKEKRKLSDKVKKFRKKERDIQSAINREQIQEKTAEAVQKTKEGKKISFDDFKNLINKGLI